MDENLLVTAQLPKKERDSSIDIMKGFLTVLMVIAHVIQFFPGGKASANFSNFVNLTTFSGFMFCLGYVFPKAYANNPNRQKSMLKNAIKVLICYYIAGFADRAILGKGFNAEVFFRMVLLQTVPAYSEFLLSFVFVFILGIFLFDRIDRLIENKIQFGIVLVFTVLLTSINMESVKSVILCTIVGGNTYTAFPVLQYGFYFLIGFYFSKKDILFSWTVLIISAILTAMFFAFRMSFGILPERFPLTLTYLVGGSLFVYAYFLWCKKINRNRILEYFGKNSISYLVITTIVISIFKFSFPTVTMHLGLFRLIVFAVCMAVSVVIVGIKDIYCRFLQKIKNQINEKLA